MYPLQDTEPLSHQRPRGVKRGAKRPAVFQHIADRFERLDLPDFIHGRFRIDEPQRAYGDGHVALLHGQLVVKGPEETVQGVFSRGVRGHEGTGHLRCQAFITIIF